MRNHSCSPGYVRGLTLLELLICLAVASIIAIAATAGLSRLLLEQRMVTQINDLVHAIHLGRNEALTRGLSVVLCHGSTGCQRGADWSGDWLLFVNTDNDEPPVTDRGEPVLLQWSMSSAARANRNHFVLRPFGLRSTNGTLLFCDRRGPAYARAVVLSYTGKPRLQSAAGRIDAPCPTT